MHNYNNSLCPLNDPETYCNPAIQGLDCTCLNDFLKELKALYTKYQVVVTTDGTQENVYLIDAMRISECKQVYTDPDFNNYIDWEIENLKLK